MENRTIHNQAEFMLFIHDYEVGDSDHEVVQAAASKYTYKNTECGAWCLLKPEGVYLGSIIEGSDAEVSADPLLYPFTENDYDEAIAYVESEVDRLIDEDDSFDDDQEEN